MKVFNNREKLSTVLKYAQTIDAVTFTIYCELTYKR